MNDINSEAKENEDTPEKGREIDDVLEELASSEDTTCGISFLRGPKLQRFANKKAYVILYGILGCVFSASYAYYNGTITTIEKRFKISSKTTGKYVFFPIF